MKFNTIAKLASVVVISAVAFGAHAGSTNPPKPRCPIGQTAVLEAGHWSCKTLTISSGSTAERAGTATPARSVTKAAPKPDFVIVNVTKLGTPGAFRVTVKNTGAAYGAIQANVWGTHHKADGGTNGAATNMPQVFGAGEQKFIDVTFVPANIDRGDRISFEVDSFKVVSEVNENNNTFAMTYK